VEIVYSNLVLGALVVFLAVLYLRTSRRNTAIAYALGVLLLLKTMGLGWLPLIFVALVFLLLTHSTFSESKGRLAMVLLLLIAIPLLSAPVVLGAPPNSCQSVENELFECQDSLSTWKSANKIDKVREVEKITKQPAIDVLGTDYLPFDEGKLQAYLSVGDYPLETASCFVSVLYPNMTYFLENAYMFPVDKPYFEGLYYKDFVVPNVTGVYPVNAHCFYNSSAIEHHALSVSFSEPKIYKSGDLITGLDSIDGIFYTLEGDGACKNIYCSANFTFSLPIGWNTDLLYKGDLFITFNTEEDKDTFEWWAYSPTSDVKVPLFNHTAPKNVMIYKEISLEADLNNTHVFDDDDEIIIGFDVYNFDDKKLFLDEMEIILVYNGSYVGDLRGNDEVVVSRGSYEIQQEIFGDVEFISGEVMLQLLLLLMVLGLILWERTTLLGGLGLILWTILYVTELYTTILLVLLGIIFMFAGYNRNKKKQKY